MHRRRRSYRGGGLGATWQHLVLQLEHAQVDVGGGRGGVDVPHHLQALQDVLVLRLPVASDQSVGVAVGRQDPCRNGRRVRSGAAAAGVWLMTAPPLSAHLTTPSTHGSCTWRGGGTSG